MPVVREPLSISQFCELVGIEPARFVDVEVNRRASTVTLVLEPEEDTVAQTSGVIPQLNTGGKKIGGRKGPKK